MEDSDTTLQVDRRPAAAVHAASGDQERGSRDTTA